MLYGKQQRTTVVAATTTDTNERCCSCVFLGRLRMVQAERTCLHKSKSSELSVATKHPHLSCKSVIYMRITSRRP